MDKILLFEELFLEKENLHMPQPYFFWNLPILLLLFAFVKRILEESRL